MDKPKHWAVLPLIEFEDVAKALCSWEKKNEKKTTRWKWCPRNMYILLWHKRYCGYYGPPACIGILDFNGHLQRERQRQGFAVKGHLLPTVKMNMYLYTDIDIFKTRHQLSFLFFEMKKKRGMNRLWETFGELFWRTCEAAGAPKLGTGAKVRLKTALKTTSLFDYWQLCNGNGPSKPMDVWRRGESSDEKRTLSGSSCLLLLLSVCLLLSPALPLLLLFDGQSPDFRTGRTEMLASFLRVHVATRFISLYLSRLDKWSSPVEWHPPPHTPPPLLITLSIEEKWITEGGDGLLKEAVTLKKKKRNNQNKQPN